MLLLFGRTVPKIDVAARERCCLNRSGPPARIEKTQNGSPAAA